MRIAIDLDNTINHASEHGYGEELIQEGALETIKEWKEQGHEIIIHTARNMETFAGNIGKALGAQGLTTLQWLEKMGIPYDELWWKPGADVYIDDKALKHIPNKWEATAQAVRQVSTGKVKVWVNGCFDILHLGHIKLLEYASEIGTVTIGLDSDSKVNKDKGPNRPYYSLEERKEMLLSLRINIGGFEVFDTPDELEEWIKFHRPDYIVVGEEYKGRVVGAQHAKHVIYFPKHGTYSTTNIMEGVK